MISAGECVATAGHACGVWRSYRGLMTDWAHWLFELTGEAITLLVGLVIGRTWLNREHKTIDAEHGVEHTADKWRAP